MQFFQKILKLPILPKVSTMSKRHTAFTLAEILITLGVIGVVAALTIPTLISNYQKAQYITALKKAYSQFNQVLSQIALDNGCSGDLACTGLFQAAAWGFDTSQPVGEELIKYFKVAQNCGLDTNQACFPNNTN